MDQDSNLISSVLMIFQVNFFVIICVCIYMLSLLLLLLLLLLSINIERLSGKILAKSKQLI